MNAILIPSLTTQVDRSTAEVERFMLHTIDHDVSRLAILMQALAALQVARDILNRHARADHADGRRFAERADAGQLG